MIRKKRLLILLPTIGLIATGCNLFNKKTTENPDKTEETGGEDIETDSTELQLFNKLVSDIKSKHNYTIEINSSFAEEDDAKYEGILANIDDKAIYVDDEIDGCYGWIKQSNQGYISFNLFNGTIYPGSFVAVNPNKGASELFQINAENLLDCEYTQDASDKTKFVTTDEFATIVAYNMCGFQAQSGGEDLVCKLDSSKKELTLTYHYWVVDSIDESGNPVNLEGTATFTIKNIGTTSNAVVSNYISNPTKTFVAPTAWTTAQQNTFNSYFGGLVPPFLTGATYAFSFKTEDKYNGVHIIVEDLLCGNKKNEYVSAISSLGFVQGTYEGEEVYQKVVNDGASNEVKTYTIKITFEQPDEYFPNGIFTIEYDVEVTNLVHDEASFNQYITAKGLTDVVPLLNFNNKIVDINFKDATENMEELYGDVMNPVYRFYSKSSTGATIKLTYNKADADAIKAGINDYISAAKAMGYTDEQSFLGTITLSKPVIDSKNSSIKITDPSSIVSGSEGTAKFDLAHQLYRVHDPRTNYSVPLSITANENIASYHFEDKNHQTITNFTDYFGGMFYLVATPVEGQVITSLSMKGDSSCEFYYALDEQSEVIPNTFIVYPSNLELNEFEITIVTTPESEVATEQTVTIGQHGNASVKINGTYNDSATFMSGSTVAFTVTCPTLYQLDSVKVVDSNSQELAVTKTGEEGTKTFYSFTMPKDDVTIVVQTSEKAVQKYSYSAATNLTGGTINLESGQAKKGETVLFTVSPSSGYELTSIFVVGDSSITISENPLHPGTYQFTMPEKDVVVSATFAQISVKHNITKPSELEEGRVLLKSESTAAAGETVSFTIEAYEGYEIESYGIENHPEITITVTPPGFMQKLNTYSFTMPDFDVNIQVTFKSIPKELTKITVSGAKTTFTVGDDFATTGLVVTASFNYGNDEDVTANAVVDSAAVNMSVAGEYNVVVSYQGKTTSYSIKVENAESGGQEVSSVKYSVTTSGVFARELTIVLNSDGTGVFTNKKVSNNTTSTFYFIWTLDNGIYTVSPDTTKTSSNFVTGSASNIYNTTDCLTNTFTINNNQLTISLVWSDRGTPVSYTFSLVD